MRQPGTGPVAASAEPSAPLRIFLHIGFVFTGIVTVLLGPILPFLAARWSLSDERAGLFFTAQFLGSLVGVFWTSLLIPRRGFSLTLSIGFGLMAIGVGALGLGSWTLGMISVFGYGIGLGLTIPGTNLWVAEAAPHRRAGALSILNLAWSVGALSCPALVDLSGRSVGLRGFESSLAVALGLLALSLLWIYITSSGRTIPGVMVREASSPTQWKNRAAVALGALFFLYVGTENALGGWVAFYAKRLSTHPGSIWLITPSFFWGALLLGRAVTPPLLRAMTERRLVLVGLLLASGGVVVLIAANTLSGVVTGASLAGLALAPIYPILIAWLKQQLGAAATRVGGAMFAMSSLGGATVPWLVGFASTRTGTLKAGLVVPLTTTLLMLAFQLSNLPGKGDGLLPPGQTSS
jgi:FHS family glucose/mannose:H+ symporter-like MFS transporter